MQVLLDRLLASAAQGPTCGAFPHLLIAGPPLYQGRSWSSAAWGICTACPHRALPAPLLGVVASVSEPEGSLRVVSIRTGGVICSTELRCRPAWSQVTGPAEPRPLGSQNPEFPPLNPQPQPRLSLLFPLRNECGFGVGNPLCYGARFWGETVDQRGKQRCAVWSQILLSVSLKKAVVQAVHLLCPPDRQAELSRASDRTLVVPRHRSLRHTRTAGHTRALAVSCSG